jgi:hypothetical protein
MPKMLLVSVPEGAQGEERQGIDQELRNERDEVPQECLIGIGAGYIHWHIDSQNLQSHGKGEDSTARASRRPVPSQLSSALLIVSNFLTIREGFIFCHRAIIKYAICMGMQEHCQTASMSVTVAEASLTSMAISLQSIKSLRSGQD